MKKLISDHSSFPLHSAKRRAKTGFTLIQLSIILTVASLLFVTTLPGIQSSLTSSAASVTNMNAILNTMRGYMAANGVLPCPADPTLAIGANNYGVAAANPGTGSPGNCIGGTPAAAYADTTNNIAIGMIPVKTLGLSYADALDGYGRDITYAVDTNATGNSTGGPCWSSSSLSGAITVNDNGLNYTTIAVLVSHGADGYGAWLPLSGTSGSATRFNNGSTDTSQAANAQVASGGGLTNNSTFVSFVRKSATSTFDDSVVYKSNLYALNTLPASAQTYPTITPPANGTYTTGQTLTFTITYASAVTVTGIPRLDLSALGSGSIGTGNKAYATYQSGSGTNALTFSYTVQSTDSAPISGLSMYSYIDLNGGNVSGGSLCFTAPSLTSVLIGASHYYRTVTIDHTKAGSSDSTSFPILFSGTYTYLKTVANGGMVTNSNGYDIYFTSDAAGTTLLPFERESWNASTGASVFWVQVPTVSHTADTVIYLQYGNSGITTDQSNATGTWSNGYKEVWHLGSLSVFSTTDSSSSGKTGTNHGVTATTGEISGGGNFNGSSYVEIPAYGGSTTNFTISTWIYMSSTNTTNTPGIVFSRDASEPIGLSLKNANNNLSYVWNNNSSSTYNWASGLTIPNTTWTYVTLAIQSSGATITMCPSGSSCSSNTNSITHNSQTLNTDFYFAYDSQTGHGYATCILDEVHVATATRSSDWTTTEYNNQSAPDKATYGASGFYTIGSQTSR